jgi:hypothetical protein
MNARSIRRTGALLSLAAVALAAPAGAEAKTIIGSGSSVA